MNKYLQNWNYCNTFVAVSTELGVHTHIYSPQIRVSSGQTSIKENHKIFAPELAHPFLLKVKRNHKFSGHSLYNIQQSP